jgi:membrane-associated protein
VGAGYWFGNVPIVKENFSLVAIAIVILSLVPIVIEYINHTRRARGPAA